MRELLLPAVIVAAAAAAVEAAAVALGWSPPLWVLATVLVVAGAVTFLVAGRLRALRLQARRRARRQVRRTSPTVTSAGEVRRIAPEMATAAAEDRGGRPPG
jgi:hypothetical protein